MYLNANDDFELASQYQVRNLDTGKIIERCVWADDDSGEYAQYDFDLNGNIILNNGNPVLIIKKGNIKLEKKENT